MIDTGIYAKTPITLMTRIACTLSANLAKRAPNI